MNINIVGKDCCGCRSCEQSCPKKCIIMKDNNEGFIYPKIDFSTCIDCGICLKKCPIYNYENNGNNPKVFALKNKDNNVMKSASGGACDIAARKIIENGGVVYGVAYDSDFNAKHIRVDNVSDLSKLQSSKYVFADTNNSFVNVKKDLESKIKVLFVGTSCQVDGLLKYLGKDYDNLFTISIICHGVPAPKLFKSYISYKEKQLNSKITSYDFRSKDKNGWSLTEKIVCQNGKIYYENLFFTSYGSDFLKGYSYRENCFNCKYCNTNRVGDLSVGDFWGIASAHPKFNDRKGVSVLLVTSEKGLKLVDEIKDHVEIIESTIDNAKISQGNLKAPTHRDIVRDTYYESFNSDPDFFKHRTPKKTFKYYLKKICPRWLKSVIKKILGK